MAAVAAFLASGAVTRLPAAYAQNAYKANRCRAGNVTWRKEGKVEAWAIHAPYGNTAEDYLVGLLDRAFNDAAEDRWIGVVRRSVEMLTWPQWRFWSVTAAGMSPAEAARNFNVSRVTAYRHIERGRQRLKDFISPRLANKGAILPTGVGARLRASEQPGRH